MELEIFLGLYNLSESGILENYKIEDLNEFMRMGHSLEESYKLVNIKKYYDSFGIDYVGIRSVLKGFVDYDVN